MSPPSTPPATGNNLNTWPVGTLFALPDDHNLLVGLTRQAFFMRRVCLEEFPALVTWVRKHFSEMWAIEMEALM
jgi:hypothetical protein